ncbi:MAG: cytochrome c [Candidatus Obscuribacterales bacterium]|nr:cytochrome c [Candidatus Obscuribacterales bacterium]
MSATTSGCVMTEEVKRINQMQAEKKRRADERSTNLSGEQIFKRTCNSCHPGAQAGMGPALDKVDQHFPADKGLRTFLRQGAGVMPANPVDVLNEKEMDNLIEYLRELNKPPES